MKNKYTIIWIVLLIFLWLNYNSFANFYYNSFWEYTKTNNVIWEYNLWTERYINSNYEISVNSFSGILDISNKELNFRVLYNLANSYYKFWEDKELNQKIELFTKSVENYRWSLNIKFDEQAHKNLEFVLEKLRIAKLEQEKEKQENTSSQPSPSEEKEQEQKSDEKEEWVNEENDWEKSDESGEKWEKQEWWDSEWWENNEWKLSEETKKILQQKEDELQKLQEEIWQYYNKNYKEKLDPFSNFNQFFDNSLIDDNEEKDW